MCLLIIFTSRNFFLALRWPYTGQSLLQHKMHGNLFSAALPGTLFLEMFILKASRPHLFCKTEIPFSFQCSKLSFSKRRLLVTFNYKVVTIKTFSHQKKTQGEDSLCHITRRAKVLNSTFLTLDHTSLYYSKFAHSSFSFNLLVANW